MRRLLLAVIGIICIAVIVLVLRSRRDELASPSVTSTIPPAFPLAPNTPIPRVVSAVPPRSAVRALPGSPPVAVPVAPDWVKLPAPIRLICGQGETKDYRTRIVAVHQLGTSLCAEDVQALYWLLRQKSSSQADLSPEAFATLKNDTLEALLRQSTLPADLGNEILGMFRDCTTDPVWRDYCVQHLPMYIERRWPDVTAPADPDRAEIFTAFNEGLQEKDSGIAGTALLSLYRLVGKTPEADFAAIRQNALTIAQDGSCASETRVTAMGICGLTGQTAILPEARILAQTAEVLPLRLASIATIGCLGTQQDKELLESLRSGSDVRLFKAADAALKRLKERAAGS